MGFFIHELNYRINFSILQKLFALTILRKLFALTILRVEFEHFYSG
jgi:hypothetical protein